MASENIVEELTHEDLGDLRERISNRWVIQRRIATPTPSEFSRLDFSRAPASQDASEPEASQFGPYPGPDLIPPETRSDAQFSSDKSGDPRDLLAQTEAGVRAHAEMNACYGLTQPVAAPGSHPWLRDSLAVVAH